MNVTPSITSEIFYNDSITMHIALWYIVCDSFQLTFTTITMILTILFLVIVIIDKTCHTFSMMLISHSCLSILMFTSIVCWSTIFALNNDLKQIHYEDHLCLFRGYLIHSICTLETYSYLFQAIYRYVTVIYPAHLFWQSRRNQIIAFVLIWIFSFSFSIPFLFPGGIVYNPDNQICVMPLGFYPLNIYLALCGYGIPVNLFMLIYWKLVRYVKQMSKRVVPTNTLLRAQRELKMVRRTVILLTIILTAGIPFIVFMFMSFFESPPKYHFRIIFLADSLALLLVMIAFFQFTDPIKTSIMKRIKRRTNIVR